MVVARGMKAVIPSGFFPKVDIPDWRYGLGIFAAAMLFVWHPFIGGPRVPSLILFLLGIVFWATSWRRMASDITQRRWLMVIACLGIPALLSLPASFSPEHTALRLLLIFGMLVVGSALIEIFQVPGVLKLLQKILAILLVIWLVDALIQMVVGYDLLGIALNAEGRVLGMYSRHLYLQWLVVLMLPLLLWGMLPDRPYLAVLALILSGIVVLGSGVRSAWLCWFIEAGVFFLSVKIPRKWMVITGLVAILGVGVVYSPLAQWKLKATEFSFDQISFEQFNSVLSGRLYLWETGWRMFLDRPLTGVGSDAFREAYGQYTYREDDLFKPGSELGPQHAHQLYLSLMAETGVLGILGIVALWGLVIHFYFNASEDRRNRAKPYGIGLLSVTFPINSQPLIYKTWWVPLLVFFLVAFLSCLDRKVEK